MAISDLEYPMLQAAAKKYKLDVPGNAKKQVYIDALRDYANGMDEAVERAILSDAKHVPADEQAPTPTPERGNNDDDLEALASSPNDNDLARVAPHNTPAAAPEGPARTRVVDVDKLYHSKKINDRNSTCSECGHTHHVGQGFIRCVACGNPLDPALA